jgi:hypothetical protein
VVQTRISTCCVDPDLRLACVGIAAATHAPELVRGTADADYEKISVENGALKAELAAWEWWWTGWSRRHLDTKQGDEVGRCNLRAAELEEKTTTIIALGTKIDALLEHIEEKTATFTALVERHEEAIGPLMQGGGIGDADSFGVRRSGRISRYSACGRSDAPARCGRCRKAWFRGSVCQRAAWRTHRSACVAAAVRHFDVDLLVATDAVAAVNDEEDRQDTLVEPGLASTSADGVVDVKLEGAMAAQAAEEAATPRDCPTISASVLD